MQSRGKAIAEIARVGAIPVNQPIWIDEPVALILRTKTGGIGLKLHRLYAAAASFNSLLSEISALRNTPTSSDHMPSERSLNVICFITGKRCGISSFHLR